MEKQYNIAVLGATGIVGQEIIKILSEGNFPVGNIFFSASKNSIGQEIQFQQKNIVVQLMQDIDAREIDFIFNAIPGNFANDVKNHFCYNRNIIIDKSGFFRNSTPLLVSGINFDTIKDYIKKNSTKSIILSTPNCCAVMLSMALYPLLKEYNAKRIVISTYQSISGAGNNALQNFVQESADILSHRVNEELNTAFNVIPFIGSDCDGSYNSGEETKISNEIKQILQNENLDLSITAVRVPVLIGHAASINIEFNTKIDLENIKKILSQTKHIKFSEHEQSCHLNPRNIAGSDDVFVGRIRTSTKQTNILDLWAISDNIRIGAALNAVLIAKYFIEE